MSIMRLLGFAKPDLAPETHGETESVRKIIAALGQLDVADARFIAAFAYLLTRPARADLEISDDEIRAMRRLLCEHGGLSDEHATLVVQLAQHQSELFGGTENFLVTREFRRIASREQRMKLLESMFAVAAADGTVSTVEADEIWRVADELGLTHGEFIGVRRQFREHLAVLK